MALSSSPGDDQGKVHLEHRTHTSLLHLWLRRRNHVAHVMAQRLQLRVNQMDGATHPSREQISNLQIPI
jgi:hypothetical protein